MKSVFALILLLVLALVVSADEEPTYQQSPAVQRIFEFAEMWSPFFDRPAIPNVVAYADWGDIGQMYGWIRGLNDNCDGVADDLDRQLDALQVRVDRLRMGIMYNPAWFDTFDRIDARITECRLTITNTRHWITTTYSMLGVAYLAIGDGDFDGAVSAVEAARASVVEAWPELDLDDHFVWAIGRDITHYEQQLQH